MDELTDDIELLDLLLDGEGLLMEEESANQILPRAHADVAALSFQQQRLWFIYEMDPTSASYNVSGGVRLRGGLNVEALRQAIDDLSVRHEPLRTSFSTDNGKPVQSILPPRPSTLELVEIADTPKSIDELVAAESSYRFNLQEGYLYRATLVNLSHTEHVLVLTMHHIICDGWSIGVLLRDLAACYQQRLDPSHPTLPPLVVQYADFSEWQQQQADREILGQQLSYWTGKLEALPNLDLRTDRPRPAVMTPVVGASYRSDLETGVVADLRKIGERSGASLAMVTMAAYQALLSRYTNQVDFAVGTAFANRSSVELEDLIGFFVNMVVIRADLADNPRFVDLVEGTRDTTLQALSQADVPLEQVVDELRPERHMHRHPLFQVSFVFQNQPERPFVLPGLTLEKIGEDTSARFDIEVFLTETETGSPCELDL